MGLVVGFEGTVFEMVSVMTESTGIRVLVTSSVLLVISLGFYMLSEGKFPRFR